MSQSINIGMHLNITELIWLKLVMIDITRLYILILILNDMTFIQGHKGGRKGKLLCQVSHKVFDQFELDLVCC